MTKSPTKCWCVRFRPKRRLEILKPFAYFSCWSVFISFRYTCFKSRLFNVVLLIQHALKNTFSCFGCFALICCRLRLTVIFARGGGDRFSLQINQDRFTRTVLVFSIFFWLCKNSESKVGFDSYI